MFDWDRSNLRKIRAHRISREEAEQALVNDAIPIYEQYIDAERRFVYYGDRSVTMLPGEWRESDVLKKSTQIPKFKNESDEADWWASREGRDYVKRRSADAKSRATKAAGSHLVAKIAKQSTIQIAIRLPEGDLKRARTIATRKGIGYQTLIKMLVHEGLQREAKSV
jgi:predicted DNA binding CopG/RHH family protein